MIWGEPGVEIVVVKERMGWGINERKGGGWMNELEGGRAGKEKKDRPDIQPVGMEPRKGIRRQLPASVLAPLRWRQRKGKEGAP